MNKLLLTVSFYGLLTCVTGCGVGGDGLQEVTGTVTYNGELISTGRIQFRAMDENQRAFAGVIENGAYSVRVAPGPAAVEIRASRPVPGKFDESNPGEQEPVGEMYIPEKYNSRTELQANIQSGVTEENFELIGS